MQEKFGMLYEIEVDINGYKTNDINEFAVFRCPFVKTSSFSILTLSIQTLIFIGIETECKAHNFLPIVITIKQNDTSVEPTIGNPSVYGETRILAVKNYIILNVETDEPIDISQGYATVILYLVNPVLYYLSTTNSYNKILEDKTGLEILEDFEEHLKSIYGDKTFSFTKIEDSKNKNNFKYEQVLICSNNDLLIPSLILQNYKPFNSFSFYFFDDFVITEKNETDIVGYFINLRDKDTFKKIDCSNASEVIIGNKYISTAIINDTFNMLNQTNPSRIVCSSDLQFKYKKTDSKNSVPNMTVEKSTSNITNDRKVNVLKTSIIKTEKASTEQTLLYTSDDIDTATKRLKIIKDQLIDNIEMVQYYYLRDTHLDFFQFGNIYNIDILDDGGYFHTPINLVNIFKRTTGRVPLLNHHMHYQLLKFK